MKIQESFKELPWYKGATVVTTNGRVLKQGFGGVVVVSEPPTFQQPAVEILAIDEISDDEVVNAFIHLHPNAGIMVRKSVHCCRSPGMITDMQILINKSPAKSKRTR